MATVKDLLRAETLRLGSVAPVAGGNAVDLIGVAKAGTVKLFLRATACSLFSVSLLKATPTTTSRFDEINSTAGSLGATGRRGRFLRLLAERAKRFTGTRGLMELLRTSRRTSAFTHTSALNVCFGGASYE